MEEDPPRPTMDQLEAEAGLTWDDALARLKDLEKTLKCEIQSNIREMKLCMTSYKIEDVSLKAARLHDIRRTLASSRALVREECAIMKEFEKIKGILGTCRTMDEDDWSDTKNQTRYWGDKLAEVRRRQRRISGDVVDLDSVVSDIITRSDLENDSVDSLDNLSFHLTSYPLFNSAPYGHHLSVPSRPGSAMSDVSAVSTGIAGYFKGRDTTTDMSQSETEQSVTPTIQKKKLFTRSSSSGRDPSLDGSEDERAGVSMEEMYMKEKHKSAMAFKKKAVSEREANLKAIEDHEDEVISEAEGFCDEDEAGISRPSSVFWKEDDGAKIEEGKNEMEQDLQKKMDEQEIQRRAEEQEFQRKMQEERKLEAAMMKEQEEEKKRIEDQENQLKEAEVEKKRIEKEKLKEQVEERKRIEAEEKKKLADEKQKKLEEKKQKEEEKKIKLEEKKKRDEEKKKKLEDKKKKEDEKKQKLEDKKKKEDEKLKAMEEQKQKAQDEAKTSNDEIPGTDSSSQPENQFVDDSTSEVFPQEAEKMNFCNENETETNEKLQGVDDKEEAATCDGKDKGSRRSASRETKNNNTEPPKSNKKSTSRSQSKEKNISKAEKKGSNSRDDKSSEEELIQSKSQTNQKSNNKEHSEKPIKSRSQSRENKPITFKDEKPNNEVSQLEEQESPSLTKLNKKSINDEQCKKPNRSRSQSRENKSITTKDEESTSEYNQHEEQESQSMTQSDLKSTNKEICKKQIKSRSQSRENKSIGAKDEESTNEASQIQESESISQEISQGDPKSTNKISDKAKKLIKSRSQSKENKPSNQKEEAKDQGKNQKAPKSRSQSRDNKKSPSIKGKNDDLQGNEEESLKDRDKNGLVPAEKSFNLAEEDQSVPTRPIKPDKKKEQSKSMKTSKSRSQSRDRISNSESGLVDSKSQLQEIEDCSEISSPQDGSAIIQKPARSRSKSRSKAKKSNELLLPNDNLKVSGSQETESIEVEIEKKSIISRSQSRDRNTKLSVENQYQNDNATSHGQTSLQDNIEPGMIKQIDNIYEGEMVQEISNGARQSRGKITRQPTVVSEDSQNEGMKSKSRSQSKEKNDIKAKLCDEIRSSSIKSQSQSKERKNLDMATEELLTESDTAPVVSKPKRSKTKQIPKTPSDDQDQIIHDGETLYCTEKEGVFQDECSKEDDIRSARGKVTPITEFEQEAIPDESQRTKSKSPSHSRGKPQQIATSNEDDPEESLPESTLPIVKPKRKKGKKQPPDHMDSARGQQEFWEENDQFVDSFKGESPDYAEIDYRNENILDHNEGVQWCQEEKPDLRGKRDLGYEGKDSLSKDVGLPSSNKEPVYAQVQKKSGANLIEELELPGYATDKAVENMRTTGFEEPIYAEVQKKKESSRTASNERQSLIEPSDASSEKGSRSLSRQASRERKEKALQRDNENELPQESLASFSQELKSGNRSVSRENRAIKSEEYEVSRLGLPDLEISSLTPDNETDFWLSEDQMDVSSTGIPDMISVKKPVRKTKKKIIPNELSGNEDSDSGIPSQTHRKGRKGLAADPGLQKYLAQNKSLNLSEAHPLEFQEEGFERSQDYHLTQSDYDEYEKAEGYFSESQNADFDPRELETEQELGDLSYEGERYGQGEMERPSSAMGQYTYQDAYPEYSDELSSYQESSLVREKPDGMDHEELRQLDPNHFKRSRNKSKESSQENDSYFTNFTQKVDSESLMDDAIDQRGPLGRKPSPRERPNNLDLKDLQPRLKDRQIMDGLFRDELHMDEINLQSSREQNWKKPTQRRRRTVSQSVFDPDDIDAEEFASEIQKYSGPPSLQPPPRKNRSRSGSASPLPQEKENIGPKLERMFSTEDDNNILEYEYDDDGVKKIKKVSFATENEQYVLRPDPEVRSIPGTKLFSFAPSKTHEQPLDARGRGREKIKNAVKKRSSSADVLPTWNKNSALNFLKSMTNFTTPNAPQNAEEELEYMHVQQMDLGSDQQFESAFAAAQASHLGHTNGGLGHNEFIQPKSVSENNAVLKDYLDQVMSNGLSSPPQRTTTQSLDNVNLRSSQFDTSLPNRPCSTEPTSASSEKKQSSLFGNILNRAKSLSRSNSRQNSEERSIFKNLFQPKSASSKRHKRSLSFDGFARKISGGSSNKTVPSVVSTEETLFMDPQEQEFTTAESESSIINRLKTKKVSKAPVDKTDFDKLFARGLALSAEKEKELTKLEANLLDHRPTTPFEVYSKDEVFKKSQQGAGISFEEKVKYFLDDLSHQPHTSTFQAPMNCSPVAAAAAVAAMAPPRSTISPGAKKKSLLASLTDPLLKTEPKESPHQFLRRAEEFVKSAEVDSEYSQPVWPAIIQSPEDLPPPKSPIASFPKPFLNFGNLSPNTPAPKPAEPKKSTGGSVLRSASIPIEVSQALAPMMACMMEMKNNSKSPDMRRDLNVLTRSASSTDPFPGSYRTDLGRAEYGTLTRKDSKNFKPRASSVSARLPQRDNSLERVQKLRRSGTRDMEINHRRRSQEPLILDHSRCDSRLSSYSADVPDLEDAEISNALMMKTNKAKKDEDSTPGNDFLRPSSGILQKKEKVLDEMTKEKLALQEAKSWLQTVILIILCICAIIFIQTERRNA